jgi:basic membrane protein A
VPRCAGADGCGGLSARRRSVVVLDVDPQNVFEVAATEDQQSVETFVADGPDESLRVTASRIQRDGIKSRAPPNPCPKSKRSLTPFSTIRPRLSDLWRPKYVQSIGQDETGLVSERRLRVGLVTDPGGIDDPYNRGTYLGLERAVRELGIRGRLLTLAPKEGYVPSLSLLARQKYDLVIGNTFFAARAIDRVATGFPDTRFAIIDVAHDDLGQRPKNVVGLVFSEEQAGYLAGHLAALVLTLSPGEEVISSVGGKRVPAVEKYIAGYEAGARGANPRVTTLNGYTDDFLDPVKGRSVALSQIAKGSRVVFQVANACGLGALEAARERGIWGIGVDVDQSHLGRHILTSAVKRLDVAVFDTIEELARGTLETGRTSRFSLRNGGVGLGTISAAVPRSLRAKIEDVRAEIVAGKISIASSVTETT